MSGPERKPGARPRARAPRTDHPLRKVHDDTDELVTPDTAIDSQPEPPAPTEPEPAPVTPPPAPATAQTFDPPVAIGGRGPQSVRTRLKVWCASRNEPMDRVLVRAITEFLDRNGG